MRYIKPLSIVCFAILLTACASTMNFTPQAKANIHKIAISPKVKMPASMYYYGTATTVGSMFGIVGDLAAIPQIEHDVSLFQNFMKKNNINVADIVRNQLTKQIATNTPFKIVSKNPDATIYITIRSYGLTIPQGFSHVYKPILFVVAKMVNKQNKVVWQNYARTSAWSSLPEYTTQQYFKDPNKLRYAFNTAAKMVSAEIAKAMNK